MVYSKVDKDKSALSLLFQEHWELEQSSDRKTYNSQLEG